MDRVIVPLTSSPLPLKNLILEILRNLAMNNSSHPTGPGVGGQALLKRHTAMSLQEFRDHYSTRHAPIAIPWCLANGVTYYAQVRATIMFAQPVTVVNAILFPPS